MKNAFQTRILAIGLALATLAVCVLAAFNLSQENSFDVPTDGVTWVEASGGLRAERVPIESPAHRAGIRTGDILEAVNEHPTKRLASYERQIYASGIWARTSYSILRPIGKLDARMGIPNMDIGVILEPLDRSDHQVSRVIALVYLSIGLYVLFRRWTAPKSTHFFIFCLVSFVLYTCKYVGQFDTLDWAFFWGSTIAAALQPALFLHFAVTFGQERSSLRRSITSSVLYLPGILIATIWVIAVREWAATELLRSRLDQIGVAYQALYYVIAAI